MEHRRYKMVRRFKMILLNGLYVWLWTILWSLSNLYECPLLIDQIDGSTCS